MVKGDDQVRGIPEMSRRLRERLAEQGEPVMVRKASLEEVAEWRRRAARRHQDLDRS